MAPAARTLHPTRCQRVPIESEICELLFLCGIDYDLLASHSLSVPNKEYTSSCQLEDEANSRVPPCIVQRIEVLTQDSGAGAFFLQLIL